MNLNARYEHTDGHYKFWEIFVEDNKVGVWWGRIGTHGQNQVKLFNTPYDTARFVEAKVREKLNKGYRHKGFATRARTLLNIPEDVKPVQERDPKYGGPITRWDFIIHREEHAKL